MKQREQRMLMEERKAMNVDWMFHFSLALASSGNEITKCIKCKKYMEGNVLLAGISSRILTPPPSLRKAILVWGYTGFGSQQKTTAMF